MGDNFAMTTANIPIADQSKEQPPIFLPEEDTSTLVTPENLLTWGRKSILAMLDQGLTSATGFCVNLLLARWLAPSLYGAFAVVFAGFLFLAGFHNVLLLEPLSVFGPSRHAPNVVEYFRGQIKVHLVLTGSLLLLILPASLILRLVSQHSAIFQAILGGSIAFPLLLLLWAARRMCYVMQKPTTAVIGAAIYFAIALAGMFLIRLAGVVSPFSAFALMGSASCVAACILLHQLGLIGAAPFPRVSMAWKGILYENWTYGRWLVGSATLYAVAAQTQVFLIPVFLDLRAAGILRAMQIPSLVVTQIIGAVGIMILPAFSADFERGLKARLRQKALFVSLCLTAVAVAFALALFAFSTTTEHLLFGAKYSQYTILIPIMALVPIASAFSTGFSSALRASRRPHFDLIANAIAAPVCVLSAIAFIHWWGLPGVAYSMVLTTGVISGVTVLSYRFRF
jgi:O-antigen/teichoic acid export membrane protein